MAINTPNSNSLNANWGTNCTSVDAIEAATGYDLLSAVPVSVQAALEGKMERGLPIKPQRHRRRASGAGAPLPAGIRWTK